MCTDGVGSYTCECLDGTYGTTCQSECPGGAGDDACNGNGTCADGVTGDGTCTCDTGFTGDACTCTPDADFCAGGTLMSCAADGLSAVSQVCEAYETCSADPQADLFAVFTDGANYDGATAQCESLGGHLAWLLSAEENTAAAAVCTDSTAPWGCLIGLDAGVGGPWDSGHPVNFIPGSVSTGDAQPHLAIYNEGSGVGGNWEDHDQDDGAIPYMCRLPSGADVSSASASGTVPGEPSSCQ